MLLPISIDTGNLDKIAKILEDKGVDLAALLASQTKRRYEGERQLGMAKFRAIKRRKSGTKRFAAPKPAIPKAEPIPKTFAAVFDDFIAENS